MATSVASAPDMSVRNETDSTNNNENEHLLQHTWVLWYRPPGGHNSAPQAKAWESSQKLYFKATTVENFWQGFHKLPRITPAHPLNCDYSLFKEGVKPMWEDDFNKFGGRWTYTLDRRPQNAGNQGLPVIIEQSWLDVMLCLIGEGFDPHGDLIAGGVCGIRQSRVNKSELMNAKIHIWTKDASDTEANMKIGEILKKVLHAPDGQLVYAPHESAGKGRQGLKL